MLRMPAEWEKHEAVWLAWPYDKISFGSLNEPGEKFNPERLPKVEAEFSKIVAELAKNERVELLIRDLSSPPPSIHPHKKGEGNIRFHQADYADVWTRDYAPSFVIDHAAGLKAVKWDYDAYSKKFPILIKDNEVFKKLAEELKMPIRRAPGVIMEGGAVEVNGAGTLITTEQCLLKRNPNLTKADYEKIFAEFLGISKVIWLKEGIAGDHTDGHIDEVARFVGPDTILCGYEEDESHENFAALNNAYETLKGEKGSMDERFNVIKLPMPHMTYRNGQKAPASYTNFYVGNDVVLIPKFNDLNDEAAFEIISKQFPNRRAVGIDCSEMIYGGGAVHCATREQPKFS